MALDYGTKRIGLASGDLEVKIAFPRGVIENKGIDFVIERVLALSEELDVKNIIIGLPLSMKEEQKPNKILSEIDNLSELLSKNGLKVFLVDERLSSFEASNLTGQKFKIDAHAAQIILQRYFDNRLS